MTTTFFLLRHAAHDDVGDILAGRCENVCLGADGRTQALRLGERMRRERFDAIVSSPRQRTVETAQAISLTCEIGPVDVDEGLDEIDFGSWSGKRFAELAEDPAWRRWNNERATALAPSGESMADVQHRIWRCMHKLCSRFPDRAVVLVSHADVIKGAICRALGLTADNCFRFDIAPASISTVVIGEWGSKVLLLNESV